MSGSRSYEIRKKRRDFLQSDVCAKTQKALSASPREEVILVNNIVKIIMQKHAFRSAFGLTLTLAMPSILMAQTTNQPPSARQELQAIHSPRSIDQEFDRLTKDLQLTPEQQKQVRPLLQEHHDKIQVLLDKNPTATRQALAGQIHAISDETHHEIHALLTDHQKELEKAMVQREHEGLENRRPSPPPASASTSAPSGA